MANQDPAAFVWSSQFSLAPASRTQKLTGDKILLPPSALEQLLAAAPVVASEPRNGHPRIAGFDPFNPYTFADEIEARSHLQDRHQQLPHPLTFRLVNPSSGRVVYAGIREFSASEGEAAVSPFLLDALGIKEGEPLGAGFNTGQDGSTVDGSRALPQTGSSAARITVHAHQLPKGTFVKLRPLEAGYDTEDWKSLLEQHLRSNFTTLTNNEVLVVPGNSRRGGKLEEFRFLVDGFTPEGEGICVVDTDLSVDIEALNEEQARETMRRIAAKMHKKPGSSDSSSLGGELSYLQPQAGQILPGDYVDYELPSWDRSQGLEIELSGVGGQGEMDVFINPYSSRQRARPREDDFVFADVSSAHPKTIRINPTNIELQDAEALWISVYSFVPESEDGQPLEKSPIPYTLVARNLSNDTSTDTPVNLPQNADETQCANCRRWVPQRTIVLHENFCRRNNILCPHGCGAVFQKDSATLSAHWHCPHDSTTGDGLLSLAKHNAYAHTPGTCPSCSHPTDFPSLAALAHHRTTTCPGKLILCRFCHLEVPQHDNPTAPSSALPEAPSAEVLLTGLTPHELADGARTTECPLCARLVRLRELDAHTRHHALERLTRPPPRPCRNLHCGRTLDGTARAGGNTRADPGRADNPAGLCGPCFGPLYASTYDPDGRALRRRVERRYLSQLLSGCGRAWCANAHCRSGRANLGLSGGEAVPTREALPMLRPLLDGLLAGAGTPLHFCVDEASQERRGKADVLAADVGAGGKGGYALEWCLGALEAEGGDVARAKAWLRDWAPQRAEVD